MARLATPLGYHKPGEPMRSREIRWFDGIGARLRRVLSDQAAPDPELGDLARRLEQLS